MKCYDSPRGGAFVDRFITTPNGPWSLTYGPDGNLYGASLQSDGTIRCFDPSTGQRLSVFAGNAAQQVVVPVIGDTLTEPDEDFYVNLVPQLGTTLSDSQGVATIVTDEVLPMLSIDDSVVLEGNSGATEAVFVVRLSEPAEHTVTVQYLTEDGSAVAGEDYVAQSGQLTFAPGQVATTVLVPVYGDALAEGDEFFTLTLHSAAGATIGQPVADATILDDDGAPCQIAEAVTLIAAPVGAPFSLPIQYRVSDGDNTLTGLGLRLHFDSSKLTYSGLSNLFATGLLQLGQPQADTEDYDSDPQTDQYVSVAWWDTGGQWPNAPLPLELYTANFETAGGVPEGSTTTVRFTASSTALSHDFLSQPVVVVAAAPVNLDVDGNGQADALTDGIVILRYLFGFTGDVLTQDACDVGGTRTDPGTIVDYLDGARSTMLDVDGNGAADALTDGIVILRYLFGFRGAALTDEAVDPAGTRPDAAAIEAFLAAYLPYQPSTPGSSPLVAPLGGETTADDSFAPNDAGGDILAATAFDPTTPQAPAGIVVFPEATAPAVADPLLPERVDRIMRWDDPILPPKEPLLDDMISCAYRHPRHRLAIDLILNDQEWSTIPSLETCPTCFDALPWHPEP